MKDYNKLKKENRTKLEMAGDAVKVSKAAFNADTGELEFAEEMQTNEAHLENLILELEAAKERLDANYKEQSAELAGRIAGAKALKIDVKKFVKENKKEQKNESEASETTE